MNNRKKKALLAESKRQRKTLIRAEKKRLGRRLTADECVASLA